MSLIETQELSIYYERSDKQKYGPLLYIGGTGGDLRNKPNQLDSPLKDFFEVISYDQRGLGQTSKPHNAYTMKQYADDAADLINKLQLPRLPVMGVSFGGMVAQELAIRHPDKVSKLVLACTSSGGRGGSSYPLHELEDLNPNDRLEQSIKINDLRIELIGEELEEFKEAIKNNDLKEAVDALTDILYVTYGAGHAFGVNLDKCFDEVQRSNMSKLGMDGKPIYNDKGKVMKGPNYFKPDLSKFIG